MKSQSLENEKPNRTSHSPGKAPLELHIGLQIFRALPINLPDSFLLLRQKTVPAKEVYHRNIIFAEMPVILDKF